ncbi:hypothetical protein AB1Y20_022523 [Prymnesium parvum]|uniref:WW domain-containing protein n=1 Tax=Prymnesium parvum TaxID=97485 RepID=A0AB34JG68_PRYPA
MWRGPPRPFPPAGAAYPPMGAPPRPGPMGPMGPPVHYPPAPHMAPRMPPHPARPMMPPGGVLMPPMHMGLRAPPAPHAHAVGRAAPPKPQQTFAAKRPREEPAAALSRAPRQPGLPMGAAMAAPPRGQRPEPVKMRGAPSQMASEAAPAPPQAADPSGTLGQGNESPLPPDWVELPIYYNTVTGACSWERPRLVVMAGNREL